MSWPVAGSYRWIYTLLFRQYLFPLNPICPNSSSPVKSPVSIWTATVRSRFRVLCCHSPFLSLYPFQAYFIPPFFSPHIAFISSLTHDKVVLKWYTLTPLSWQDLDSRQRSSNPYSLCPSLWSFDPHLTHGTMNKTIQLYSLFFPCAEQTE